MKIWKLEIYYILYTFKKSFYLLNAHEKRKKKTAKEQIYDNMAENDNIEVMNDDHNLMA